MDDLSNDTRVFRIMLSRNELSRLTWFIKDAKIPKEVYFNDEARAERNKQAKAIGEELETQWHKEWKRILEEGTIRDDVKGTVKLPIFDKKYARNFDYKCKACGFKLIITSDDGHLAKRYWEENHKHGK